MPQPIEKLNRVLKAMSRKSNPIPFPRPSLLSSETEEEVGNNKWKLAWMTVYDECRMELAKLRSENASLSQNLITERAKNSHQLEKNRLLAEKLKEEWQRSDRKSEKIKKLRGKLYELQSNTKCDKDTQTDSVNMVNSCTQYETPNVDMKRSRRVKAIGPIKTEAIVRHMKNDRQIKKEDKKYVCPNCPYSTMKKSAIDDHISEFCVKAKPVLDVQCKFCLKWKTRRGLRIHINGFLTGNHKPTGKHASITLAEHQAYRQEI